MIRLCGNIKEICRLSLVGIEGKAQEWGSWMSTIQWATTVGTRTMHG